MRVFVDVAWLHWFLYWAFWELVNDKFRAGPYCSFLGRWLDRLFGV